jgi:hypothetical protein
MPHRGSTGQLLFEFVVSSKSSLLIMTELAAVAISPIFQNTLDSVSCGSQPSGRVERCELSPLQDGNSIVSPSWFPAVILALDH